MESPGVTGVGVADDRARQISLWLVLLACLSCSATAAQLRDVWEFNLGTDSSGAPLEVFGLSFSPDGKRIAVLVGRSWEQEFVLLLDTADPRSGQRRLEFNPKISEVGRMLARLSPGPHLGSSLWSGRVASM